MKLPTKCPSCDSLLTIKCMRCEQCETEVNGSYELPMLARLAPADQNFIIEFVKSSGSLKEMSKYLNLSYPTVRNVLDEIIKKIENYEK